MARKTKNEKCVCNPSWGAIAAIVFAIAAFLGVQGFAMQLQTTGFADMTTIAWIIGYYFAAFILVLVGKMLKYKAVCDMHRHY
jgi:hypothetical protein